MHLGIGKSRDVPWRGCCAARSTQHVATSATPPSRLARQAQQAHHKERDRHDTQLSLLCNVYKVMVTVIRLLFYVSCSLIYWSIYLFNISLDVNKHELCV